MPEDKDRSGKKPGDKRDKDKPADTGDGSNAVGYGILLVMSAIGLLSVIKRKKKVNH